MGLDQIAAILLAALENTLVARLLGFGAGAAGLERLAVLTDRKVTGSGGSRGDGGGGGRSGGGSNEGGRHDRECGERERANARCEFVFCFVFFFPGFSGAFCKARAKAKDW